MAGEGSFLVNRGVEGSGGAQIFGKPYTSGIDAAIKQKAALTPKVEKQPSATYDLLKKAPKAYFDNDRSYLTKNIEDIGGRFTDRLMYWENTGKAMPASEFATFQNEMQNQVMYNEVGKGQRSAWEGLNDKLYSDNALYDNDHNRKELYRWENPESDSENYEKAGRNPFNYRKMFPLDPEENIQYKGFLNKLHEVNFDVPATGGQWENISPDGATTITTKFVGNDYNSRMAGIISAQANPDVFRESKREFDKLPQEEKDQYKTLQTAPKQVRDAYIKAYDGDERMATLAYSPEKAWAANNYEQQFKKAESGKSIQFVPGGGGDEPTYDLMNDNLQDKPLAFATPLLSGKVVLNKAKTFEVNKKMTVAPARYYDNKTGKYEKFPTVAKDITLVDVVYGKSFTETKSGKSINRPTLFATVKYTEGKADKYVSVPYSDVENWMKKNTKVNKDGKKYEFDPYATDQWGVKRGTEDFNINTPKEIENQFKSGTNKTTPNNSGSGVKWK